MEVLHYERLAECAAREILAQAIKRSKKDMPQGPELLITRLSASHDHVWSRAEAGCDLDDQTSCPRAVPTRLTHREVGIVREIAESVERERMSLRALAMLLPTSMAEWTVSRRTSIEPVVTPTASFRARIARCAIPRSGSRAEPDGRDCPTLSGSIGAPSCLAPAATSPVSRR
jgi:hypothetical protein